MMYRIGFFVMLPLMIGVNMYTRCKAIILKYRVIVMKNKGDGVVEHAFFV
jgi:hypothetical protein